MSPPGTTVDKNQGIPLVVRNAIKGQSISTWVANNIGWICQKLSLHGALLFRDFNVTLHSFEQLISSSGSTTERFPEESSPRTRITGDVYTSTDHPEEYPIQFHCEYSYANRWPMHLLFCCLTPPSRGGSTLIADTRQVLNHIEAGVAEAFIARRILYRRRYFERMGVQWRSAFRTSSSAAVEEYCKKNEISLSWSNGCLKTEQIQDAVVLHPKTRERLWFNHGFFFNVRSIEPAEIRDVLIQCSDTLSTNTYFGDGGEISSEIIHELRHAYDACAVKIEWEKGDLLLLDNMLTAHARESFQGPREVVVGMIDGFERGNLPVFEPVL